MDIVQRAGIEFIVDDRESDVKLLYGLAELGADKKRLPHHDIIVGPWGVERKEASDFLSSIFDGRLMNQQAGASESGKRRVLVIEGSIPEAVMKYRGNNFSEGLYYKVLSKLTAIGVTLVSTQDVQGTVLYIEGLLERAKEPIMEVNEHLVKLKRVSTYEAMLRQVPGMGPGKAAKVMEKWPSFKDLMFSTLYELVPILGPVSAEKLWEALGKPVPQVYKVLGFAKASDVCQKLPYLEEGTPQTWEDVKAASSAITANKLWDVGLTLKKK